MGQIKSGLSAYTPVDFSRSACGKSDLGLTINHLLMFFTKDQIEFAVIKQIAAEDPVIPTNFRPCQPLTWFFT